MLLLIYMEETRQKVILAILDGWGVAPPNKSNAIAQARTPNTDEIEQNYFALSLQASSMAVGLPWGEEGNSEVGHMNMGAGRIIYQYHPRITEAIRDASFFKNEALLNALSHVKHYNSTLHIMGLVSCGTVHSSLDHAYGLIELAKKNNVKKFAMHAFTDGKNCAPNEGARLIIELEKRLADFEQRKVSSVVGRLYAMDRNRDWESTRVAYELLVNGVGNKIDNAPKYIEEQYKIGKNDFDIDPAVIGNGPRIGENDAVVFFNFREDSARQLTRVFVESDFDKFARVKINNLFFVTMTAYAQNLPVSVVFPPPIIENHLTEVLSENNLKQLHVAESEKYAHITYFFNGANERSYPGEDRKLLMSEGGPYYDKKPQMRAYDLTQIIIENIDAYDFLLINYANADIVGHTGNFESTVKAVEAVDANIGSLMQITKTVGAVLIISSDHGNAEEMYDTKTGEKKIRHTKNPVPFYIVGKGFENKSKTALFEQEPKGMLADIAPTILDIMEIEKPKEMSGKTLLQLI